MFVWSSVKLKPLLNSSLKLKYSPAKKIELGISDFGLCPTESLISFRTKKNPLKLYALATIFKKDISTNVDC